MTDFCMQQKSREEELKMKQDDKYTQSHYHPKNGRQIEKKESVVDKFGPSEGFKYEVNYSVGKPSHNLSNISAKRTLPRKKRGIRVNGSGKAGKIIVTVLIVLVICFGALSGYLYYRLKNGTGGGDGNVDGEYTEHEQLSEQIDKIKSELESVNKEKEALLSELTKLKEETSDVVSILTRVSELEERIAAKDSEIASLSAEIVELQSGYIPDEKKVAGIYSMISSLLASPPLITEEKEIEVDVEVYDSDTGLNEVQKKVVSVRTERLPKIGICYTDIATGYTYSVNGDEIFDSASVVKAPYVLSLLQLASEEHDRRESLRIAAYAEGREISDEELGEFIYDMDKIFVYTGDSYHVSGSGVIAESGENVEYSYRDLFDLLLRKSDNVAFEVLKNEYGYDALRNFVKTNDLKSMASSLKDMSPKDGCAIMKLIYDFTESGAAYSTFMKDALINSTHTVVIPAAISDKTVAHKYGWDVGAYHDIGIVYDEHPYVVSVFSDYDKGGTEVNEYLGQILKLIDMLHAELHD